MLLSMVPTAVDSVGDGGFVVGDDDNAFRAIAAIFLSRLH